MPLRSTYRPHLGPFRINTGRRGVTSVSVRAGGVTLRLWGRGKAPGVSSVDLPGPVSYRPRAKRQP